MRTKPLSRAVALITVVAAGAALAAGVLAYRRWFHLKVVSLQLAGTAARARAIVGGNGTEFGHALQADFALIAGYLVAILAAAFLGRRVFWMLGARRMAASAGYLAIAGAVANLGQDVLLLLTLRHPPALTGDWAYRSIQALAFTKFVLLTPAAVVALLAWVITAGRLLLSLRPALDVSLDPADKQVVPPPPADITPHEPPAWSRHARAARAARTSGQARDLDPDGEPGEAAATGESPQVSLHWQYGATLPPDRPPADVGICVSGGGIRSACVALGALQALREAGEFGRAGYLVSVSGGGFSVGAMLHAMAPPPPGEMSQRVQPPYAAGPADVFAPGTVEEDYFRRHSDYVADGARQWLGALGVVARGLLASVALIGLTVTVAGVAAGRFYRLVSVVPLTGLRRAFVLAAPPRFPAISGGVALAIGAAAAAAAVLYLASLTGAAFFGGRPRLLLDAGKRVLGAAGLLVVGGVVIPAVMWGSVWLSATRPAAFHAVSSVTTAGAGTVVLAYVGTLVGVLWRSRRTVSSRGPAAAGLLRKRPSGGSFATTLFQRVIIYAALTVLCVALLVLFGLVATWAGSWPGWLIVTLVAVLAAVGALLDQTWLSMHPFYRRRLASAIAVRRGRTRGRVAAAPYSFAESTPLTEYADPARYPGFPKVIFAAAANLSGQDRTPPNRRATQFTFASDYVGGPEVGWVSTAKLSEIVSRQVRRDLTTQAAVAISGAAFASAMGVQSRPYDTFFALTNARLGSWLPNPGFLIERAERANWAVPRLPRLRRLSYLLREIFGLFPSDDRMLLCTDGGHYDNLGLIELLRHRCKLIYCIDASGDSPPLAQSLGGTVALAREELGVEIALTDPLDLVPGSAGRLEPHDPLAGLNHRLSAAAVRTGTITYPADVTFPGGDVTRTGRLVFAKASLTADMPYELLSYAIQNVAFPHDSTGDQWFDHRQFDSYTQLGQILGHRAAEAAGAAPQPPGGAAP